MKFHFISQISSNLIEFHEISCILYNHISSFFHKMFFLLEIKIVDFMTRDSSVFNLRYVGQKMFHKLTGRGQVYQCYKKIFLRKIS
jgi:hypothetical protein